MESNNSATKKVRGWAEPKTFTQQLKDVTRIRSIVKIGALGALGFLLMELFQIPMPFAPAFMKVDFGDVPGLIGGFAMGPVAGFLIQLVKNILKLFTSETVGVGELSNLIVGSTFVLVSSIIYRRSHNKKGAIVGLIVGSLAMSCIAVLSNTFFIFPAYAAAIKLDLDVLATQIGAANGLVSNYMTLMLFSVFPFNLVKTLLESVVTLLLYKRISPILHSWS